MDIKKKNLIILFICLIISGILGIVYNLITEFDFINYRFYNGWAFWNNRLDIDILPTAFRTYFNPLVDALNFLLIDRLNKHPYIFLFISGFKFGLFMFLSYLIFDFVFTNKNFEKKFFIFSALVITAFSPIILFVTGYGQTDLQTAVLILFSLYLFLKTIFEEKNKKNSILLIISAIITGMATGLKYTNGIFGLTFLLSIIVFNKSVKNPIKSFLLMFCGMFAGFLITNGFWMYTLWTHFKNPFFPYFNSFFHSQFSDSNEIFTDDFSHLRPKNIIAFLFAPLKNPSWGNVGNEWGFFDLKIQLTFISIVIYMIINKFYNAKNQISTCIQPKYFNLIIFIVISTYYINLILFGQLRYVTELFALSSIIILVVCYLIISISKFKDSEPNFYNISLVLLCTFLYAGRIHNLQTLMLPAITITYLYAVLIFIIVFSKKILPKEKNIITSISLIVIITIISGVYIIHPIDYSFFYKVANIKNMHIKDNSNVILGTMATSFVVPKQNPKAKYIGFAIPFNYEKQGFYSKHSKFKNMYFKNKYLEQKLKDVFKEDKDLYFVYAEHGAHAKDDRLLYTKSVRYYSNNKIKIIKNCNSIPYNFLNDTFYGNVKICKLK